MTIMKQNSDKVTVFDIAAYLVDRLKKIKINPKNINPSNIRMLLYYSQGWSLAWNDEPLFDEIIEACHDGPVIPALEDSLPNREKSNISKLTHQQKKIIDKVILHYGDSLAGEEMYLPNPIGILSNDPRNDALEVITHQRIKDDFMVIFPSILSPEMLIEYKEKLCK